MIYEVTGDILLSKCRAIVHGVGVDDDFKSELALALRKEWPALAKDFRHYCKIEHPKPGTLWVWQGAGGKQIINLITQEPPRSTGQHPGPAHVEYVHQALRDLRKLVIEAKIESIALPRLATGVGGLEWKDVQPLIKKHLEDIENCRVVVYSTYRRGVEAKEQ